MSRICIRHGSSRVLRIIAKNVAGSARPSSPLQRFSRTTKRLRWFPFTSSPLFVGIHNSLIGFTPVRSKHSEIFDVQRKLHDDATSRTQLFSLHSSSRNLSSCNCHSHQQFLHFLPFVEQCPRWRCLLLDVWIQLQLALTHCARSVDGVYPQLSIGVVSSFSFFRLI